ncbi:GntR family transcriptional regulator [Paenibacillus cymbidii]|uniref:GntR family transcriptional regulator n=1 Tax=Paenibacillus cymbidii TaxID=1639034 RepID=UPI0010814700|nr:substrate-binding domain-containing protein [Paenibacillus cymbidii]
MTGPLYKHVYQKIKHQIHTGKLQANAPLPNQVELAKQFQVSEVTVKRALQDLVKEGLIVRYRKKGTFVNQQNHPYLPFAEHAVKTIYLVHSAYTGIYELNNVFITDMIEGIMEVTQERGLQFRICNENEVHDIVDPQEFGFILLSDSFDVQVMEKWCAENRRMINVHMYFPHLNIPFIIVDNYTGGYLATQHLLSLQHRRIGIILPEGKHGDINQEFNFRLQGYALAMAQYRIEQDPSLIVKISRTTNAEDVGYEGCKKLLAFQDPPTAIFATTDHIAFGAIRAIKEHGMTVPGDISIIGYGDSPISKYLTPSLSSVQQNTRLLGKRAVQTLLFEWDGKPDNERLKPTLIVRESTALSRTALI